MLFEGIKTLKMSQRLVLGFPIAETSSRDTLPSGKPPSGSTQL